MVSAALTTVVERAGNCLGAKRQLGKRWSHPSYKNNILKAYLRQYAVELFWGEIVELYKGRGESFYG